MKLFTRQIKPYTTKIYMILFTCQTQHYTSKIALRDKNIHDIIMSIDM